MATKREETLEFREFLAWLPRPLEQLTDDEYTGYVRAWCELERSHRQSTLRRARREAYARDRERRARAHRLITLGAEVEASGLAEAVAHDPDGVFGAGAIFAANAANKPELVARAAELGRQRDVARSSPAWTRKRGGKPSTERWRIAFATAPPAHVREALRARGFKWRLGLRAWVGDALEPRFRQFVEVHGARVSERPTERG
jgi:hypothetical protein